MMVREHRPPIVIPQETVSALSKYYIRCRHYKALRLFSQEFLSFERISPDEVIAKFDLHNNVICVSTKSHSESFVKFSFPDIFVSRQNEYTVKEPHCLTRESSPDFCFHKNESTFQAAASL